MSTAPPTTDTAPVSELVSHMRKAEAARNRAQKVIAARVRDLRCIILDAHDAGMCVSDIAAALGITRGSVYAQLNAAENGVRPKYGKDASYGKWKKTKPAPVAEIVELTAADITDVTPAAEAVA